MNLTQTYNQHSLLGRMLEATNTFDTNVAQGADFLQRAEAKFGEQPESHLNHDHSGQHLG